MWAVVVKGKSGVEKAAISLEDEEDEGDSLLPP